MIDMEKLKRSLIYPVIYMFVVTFLFTSVIVGISHATRERVEANKRVMFERAVLMALPLDVTEDTPSIEVHEIFAERVKGPSATSAGAYLLMEEDRLIAYALPITGRGFWDLLSGIIGIRIDKRTLTGIAFYEQRETPGLGAEITKAYFREQFKGLKIKEGDVPVRLLPVGTRTSEHEVHAITGATQTCTRLERIINQNLRTWREEMGAGS